MLKKEPLRTLDVPSDCENCKRKTLHTVNVLTEGSRTVTNTRKCNTCGCTGTFYSPANMFKLFAAGAVASGFIFLFLTFKNIL